MALKTIDVNTLRPYLSSLAFKAGMANLVMGLAGLMVCMLVGRWFAVAFSGGLIIGTGSLYISLRILRAGIKKGPDKAASYVTSRYYLKFFATITAFVFIVWQLELSPLAISAGYIGTIFTTIGAILVVSREEFQHA